MTAPFRPVLNKESPVAGIVAPASPVDRENLERALPVLEKKGWRLKLGENLFARDRFCAGTDEQRARDLHAFFADGSVDLIVAARGGYGTTRILPLLDYDFIAEHPKPFVGLSDTTALQNALLRKSNIVTFSGFVLSIDVREGGISPVTESSLDDALAGIPQTFRGTTLYAGEAKGTLTGGCLSLMECLTGTPYLPDMRGSILLLEDVGEDPYRIDRMMSHLFSAGVFDGLAGIAFGEFYRCSPKDKNDGSVNDVLNEWGNKLKIPAVGNIIYGHQPNHCVVPVGGQAVIENGALCVF